MDIRIDQIETGKTKKRYQRISAIYNLMEIMPERLYAPWRERLWSQVKGPQVLEVGVGTGKNIPYYPQGLDVTAIDLTPGMIKQAKKRADELNIEVNFSLADIQRLDFPSNSFDAVVSTFVFCSVPNPNLGLLEVKRVLKPGKRAYFLEHVRSNNTIVGNLMDLLNPLIVRLMGPNINRNTVDNIRKSGLSIIKDEKLFLNGIFRMVIAEKK